MAGVMSVRIRSGSPTSGRARSPIFWSDGTSLSKNIRSLDINSATPNFAYELKSYKRRVLRKIIITSNALERLHTYTLKSYLLKKKKIKESSL